MGCEEALDRPDLIGEALALPGRLIQGGLRLGVGGLGLLDLPLGVRVVPQGAFQLDLRPLRACLSGPGDLLGRMNGCHRGLHGLQRGAHRWGPVVPGWGREAELGACVRGVRLEPVCLLRARFDRVAQVPSPRPRPPHRLARRTCAPRAPCSSSPGPRPRR